VSTIDVADTSPEMGEASLLLYRLPHSFSDTVLSEEEASATAVSTRLLLTTTATARIAVVVEQTAPGVVIFDVTPSAEVAAPLFTSTFLELLSSAFLTSSGLPPSQVLPFTPAQVARNTGTRTVKTNRGSRLPVSRQHADPAAKRFDEDLLEAVRQSQSSGISAGVRALVTFVAAGVSVPVFHGLQGKSHNYIVVGTDTPMSVSDGVDSTGRRNNGTLWLQSTAPGTATVLVF
jgi:hypothetical protein